MLEHEILEPGQLLAPSGRLREAGWARWPLLAFDPEQVGGPVFRRLRLKQWDYYGIWAGDFYASAAIAHVGYLGMAFVYVLDPATGRNPERTVVRLLGSGIAMPRDSERGSLAFAGGGLEVALRVAPGMRQVRVRDPRFDRGAGLEIQAELVCSPDHESVVMATPFRGRGFFYNRKLNVLPASGFVRWGARRIELAAGAALGQLDWGRGVWPYRSHWIWASANGFAADGRRLGLNLGFVRDERAAAENAVIVDGRVHKLGWVDAEFDRRDYRKPWRFRDREGRLDVTLTPSFERVARTEALALRSEVHQCFGRWSGRALLEDDRELAIQGLPGFAEEHHSRWGARPAVRQRRSRRASCRLTAAPSGGTTGASGGARRRRSPDPPVPSAPRAASLPSRLRAIGGVRMSLIHVLTTRPRPEMARTYEGIVQRIAERARGAREKFRWTAHQTLHGASPAYHFVSEAPDWTTLSAGDLTAVAFVMRLFGSKDGQRVRDELAACASHSVSRIGRDRPDLSCLGDEPELDRGRAPFAMVTRVAARPGHQEAAEELMRKIAEAIPKLDDPTRIAAYQTVIGPLRSYWTVRPLLSLGDLDAQSMPGDLLVRAFGSGEGGLVYRSGLDAIEHSVRTIVALRPELSNMG